MKIDKHPYNILIIEDNLGDYVLIEDYLLEHIHAPNLVHAKKFQEAQNLLLAEGRKFDVILMDLSLPDINKDTLLEEIKIFSYNTPIIILTGNSDLDFAIKSLSKGVSDYLVKDTINPLVLYKSIVYTLERFRFYTSLKASQQRYMDIFHLSPAPMWVYDVNSLAFLDVNAAAVRHYGYSEAEFLSMTIKEIRPPEDIPILMESINHEKHKARYFQQGSYRHQKKNGDIIDVEITSNAIQFNGIPAEIILSTDITEKLMHIKAIEKQNQNLKDIAWTQSHVVRAPVSRLLGMIDLIKEDLPSEEEKEILLEHIYSSALEIDEIIKEIVSKSQSVFNVEKG
ncbi:PAS domain S-box protein [Arenibacter sp. 6A1]|uniref:response regulator n=1 Tax=Arenibacter sp. 6A1 TaxID=2720391 RepID=UPI0014486B30|nr:PAS domain S-box protein [Arenibacter sp. 6A1]NKI25236.1 PAS domain S-box protein [Arenibacter sp. 6A1]